MNKFLLGLIVIPLLVSCKTDNLCSTFISSDTSITQLTNHPKCFIGKRVRTSGYVQDEQLGIFIYENPSDREFNRSSNAIVFYKGPTTSDTEALFEKADFVELEIFYGGAYSIDEVINVRILNSDR